MHSGVGWGGDDGKDEGLDRLKLELGCSRGRR